MSASSVREQAWVHYQEIEHVIVSKYKLNSDKWMKYSDISQALQRLGEAVLVYHRLKNKELGVKKWDIKLHKEGLANLRLSTIHDMIHAKIPEWQDAIPSIPDMQVGEDSWVDGVPGRRAGYRPQASLQEVLKCDYFKLKAIVLTSPEDAWKIFERVQAIAFEEINRLASISSAQGNFRDKAIEIHNAVERLKQAILYKYSPHLGEYEKKSTLELEHLESIDLYSTETMLHAKCREWESYIPPFTEVGFLFGRSEGYKTRLSVSDALNLSRANPFSIFKLQGPLWGKSNALLNAEKKLHSDYT